MTYTHGSVHTDVHTERVHTCGTCGNVFTPTAAGQRYCPPTDEDRARSNGQARSQCATRAKNHAQRTREGRQTRPLNAPLPRPFTCGQCGKACTPGKDGVAPHAERFCGYDCKARWHRRRALRRARAEAQIARAARGTRGRRLWIEGRCPVCTSRFISTTGNRRKGYCSRSCLRRAVSGKPRRRARNYGVGYEVISSAAVFARDGYRCGICGQQTNPQAVVPGPRAPTIDHVVAMSRGGPHLYSNVQCACFECNSRKGAGPALVSVAISAAP